MSVCVFGGGGVELLAYFPTFFPEFKNEKSQIPFYV